MTANFNRKEFHSKHTQTLFGASVGTPKRTVLTDPPSTKDDRNSTKVCRRRCITKFRPMESFQIRSQDPRIIPNCASCTTTFGR